MIHQQLTHAINFPKEKFDFDSLDITSVLISKLQNLILGKQIDKHARKLIDENINKPINDNGKKVAETFTAKLNEDGSICIVDR